ncbi:histone chaperone ASF1A-like [Schistocerca serialis cubense]|uniref:histone chaperone ASF1A-like n=1 Tax=Schistocerca serialis cubense TaxID=2023355 RepID=UPI00214E56EC|nr:histone chaperone ASF1A-like [Schistocerca serialis cubense]
MAEDQVMNVVVLDNPSAFLNPFQFEITVESIEDSQEDLEWKIIYEFIRVGYYVNNYYTEPELQAQPPATPEFDKLQRNIFAINPTVTRFKVDSDDYPSRETSSGGGENGTSVMESGSTTNSMRSSLEATLTANGLDGGPIRAS